MQFHIKYYKKGDYMKKGAIIAIVSVLAVFSLLFIVKPTNADELLEKTVKKSENISSYSATTTSTVNWEGQGHSYTIDIQATLTPELAYQVTGTIFGRPINLTYSGGKAYLESKEIPLSEDIKAILEERIKQGGTFSDIEELIDPSTLEMSREGDIYKLNFELDKEATKSYMKERLETSEVLATLGFDPTSGALAKVDGQVEVAECKYEYEIDKRTGLVTGYDSTYVIELGPDAKQLIFTTTTSNFEYDQVSTISAP